jgi:hypothetical protein
VKTNLVAQKSSLSIHKVAHSNIRQALQATEADLVIERRCWPARVISETLTLYSVSSIVLEARSVPPLPQGPDAINVDVVFEELPIAT